MAITEIKAKSYTLTDEGGNWLGQIMISNDGMFSSVTDYGNISNAWRNFGKDFRLFLINTNEDYFATKLYVGMTYIVNGKKCEDACKRFSKMILPALKEVLKKDIEQNPNF